MNGNPKSHMLQSESIFIENMSRIPRQGAHGAHPLVGQVDHATYVAKARFLRRTRWMIGHITCLLLAPSIVPAKSRRSDSSSTRVRPTQKLCIRLVYLSLTKSLYKKDKSFSPYLSRSFPLTLMYIY